MNPRVLTNPRNRVERNRLFDRPVRCHNGAASKHYECQHDLRGADHAMNRTA